MPSGNPSTRSQLPAGRLRRVALLTLSVLFVAAGVNHFVNPGFYVRIMPPYLPAPLALVYVSGVLEILGGLAVLPRRFRRAAGWGLILLLLGVFPANLHMALNPHLFPDLPEAALWIRLPLQALLIVWVWWATRESDPRPRPDSSLVTDVR